MQSYLGVLSQHHKGDLNQFDPYAGLVITTNRLTDHDTPSAIAA